MREWLKKRRIQKGLTMKQIAEKLRISESYYSAIEAGTRQKKMDVVLMAGIAAALNVPVSKIVQFETEKEVI